MLLHDRAVASSKNRVVWLAARSMGFTATEAANLRKGGAAYERELIASKLAGGQTVDLNHIPRINWGNIREPIIAAWIEAEFGIHPNDVLFHAEGNERHLATPDGIESSDGVISEIKTSKYNLDPNSSVSHYLSTGYGDQMQWQMHVTGAEMCLFVWEQHNDDWSYWPTEGPKVLGSPRIAWVMRDDKVIAELVTLADNFLAALDAAKAGVEEEIDPRLTILSREVIVAAEAESKAKREKDTARAQLTAYMTEAKITSKRIPQLGLVSLTGPSTEEVQDDDAAREADPELWDAVETTRRLWDEHRVNFTKTKETPGGRLTVTAEKGKK